MRSFQGLGVTTAVGVFAMVVAGCSSSPGATKASSGLEDGGAPSSPPVEAGSMQGPAEAGMAPDAGSDAAAPADSSGTTPTDASASADTSTMDSAPAPGQDAGPPPLDATVPDTSVPGADAGPVTADAAAYVWTNISYGVNGATFGTGKNIAIVYGGYTATDLDSESLVLEYSATRLGQLGVGAVYAVRGPEDPDYAAREIGNSELVTAIEPQITAADYLIIIAHSSGAFVADEFFTEATAPIISKIIYFDLDGGTWALTESLVTSMKGVYFCDAHDSVAGDSANTSSIQSLYAEFSGSHLYTVDADGSGCDVGAVWCLHDTLITSKPHDPTTYDLDDDYTDFSGGRHVQTGYFDQAVSDGVL
jgi:hypothetical protein